MGLDSVGIEIYDIHGYFRGLTVGQRTPGFWGVTIVIKHLVKCHDVIFSCLTPLSKS